VCFVDAVSPSWLPKPSELTFKARLTPQTKAHDDSAPSRELREYSPDLHDDRHRRRREGGAQSLLLLS